MRDIKKILTQNQMKNPDPLRVYLRVLVFLMTPGFYFLLEHHKSEQFSRTAKDYAEGTIGTLNIKPSRCAWGGSQETADHLARTDRWLNN